MNPGLMEAAPIGLVAAVILAFGAGLAILRWGAGLPRRGDWVVAFVLFLLLAGAGLSLRELFTQGVPALIWQKGWIWRRQEGQAIGAGLIFDWLGLSWAALAAILSLGLIFARGLIAGEPRLERHLAAAAVSTAGLVVSLISLTPWISFLGVAICALGGFIGLGSRWDSDSGASVASRYLQDRSYGLVLMVLGGAALASSGMTLAWNPLEPATTTAATANASWLGALLLVTGVFGQCQPFPLLGWVVMKSESAVLSRMVFAQVFPAWAALFILIRFEAPLREIGVFPAFGWVALVCSALTAFTGLLQNDWRLSVSAWAATSFTLAGAAICFAGPTAGMLLALATGLAVIGITAAGRLRRGSLAKVCLILNACLGSGMIAFVSAGGSVRWLSTMAAEAPLAVAVAIVLFLSHLLLWKIIWKLWSLTPVRPEAGAIDGWSQAVPIFPVLLGLGVWWTGSLTGGALMPGEDRVLGSLTHLYFGTADHVPELGNFLTASWLHWATVVVAFGLAYWLGSGNQDAWEKLGESFPSAARFFGGGYGIDAAFAATAQMTSRGVRAVDDFLDRKVWSSWLPTAFRWTAGGTSRAVLGISERISMGLETALRRGIEIPSKLLQLVQNGDVQWYLFFAIGTVIAILLHFLRYSE